MDLGPSEGGGLSGSGLYTAISLHGRVSTCNCGHSNKLCSDFEIVPEPVPWCHDRIVSVFETVMSEDPRITALRFL